MTLTFNVEAYSPEGWLVRELVNEVVIDYSPVRIAFTEPCYRDAVFDSQKIDHVAGTVTLEEGVGRPLEIALTGEGTDELLQRITEELRR